MQIALNCMVKLAKGRPHLSQSVVETLLTQLHSAQDAARILMCHCLAAIAMQLPVLGDGMLGDLMELYKVIGRSATDKQQELLVKSHLLNLPGMKRSGVVGITLGSQRYCLTLLRLIM